MILDKFEFEFNNHYYLLSGVIVPGEKGITSGPPDNWSPTFPPEFELNEIYFKDGRKTPKKFYDYIENQIVYIDVDEDLWEIYIILQK